MAMACPTLQCFFVSPGGCSLATVNLKPLLPGHVLVIPKRAAATLKELSSDELADLWATVRCVQRIVKGKLGMLASELGIQDGRDAGQSVPHVHIHVIPR
jgi:bis(5'-adenosyl)-triphosphatase